jgi:2,3-bisphosphoglycerate-dependent phosphoglycerate mutase
LALQGLNKAETVKKYGADQVQLWRRSYNTPPPPLSKTDPTHPANNIVYKDIDPRLLPDAESLKNTLERVIPFFKEKIETEIKTGKKVILSAHSNSIRAIVKYLDHLSDEEIVAVNVPYCIPLIYEFDDGLKVVGHKYLASDDEVGSAIESIKNQTKGV